MAVMMYIVYVYLIIDVTFEMWSYHSVNDVCVCDRGSS